jgi:hypothetical protein
VSVQGRSPLADPVRGKGLPATVKTGNFSAAKDSLLPFIDGAVVEYGPSGPACSWRVLPREAVPH